jgi:large subunit ribosomal protein L14
MVNPMKGIAGRMTHGVQVATRLLVTDNTGAKEVEIFAVPNKGNTHRKTPSAGIGDLVIASVKKGTPQMKKQVVYCIIVRQKRLVRRPDGTMLSFEDNAVVIADEKGEVKGSEIKGPVAREAAERWPTVASKATMIF